jgi:hypothetical protein
MWVINATARPLYPRERDPVPIIRIAKWVPGTVWTGAIIPPPGFDLGSAQSVASRYTDCAIPAALMSEWMSELINS